MHPRATVENLLRFAKPDTELHQQLKEQSKEEKKGLGPVYVSVSNGPNRSQMRRTKWGTKPSSRHYRKPHVNYCPLLPH